MSESDNRWPSILAPTSLRGTTVKRNTRRRKLQKRTRRLKAREGEYVILNIRDSPRGLLQDIGRHLAICWPDNIQAATNAYFGRRYPGKSTIDIQYLRNPDGKLVVSRILTRMPEKRGVYVNKTCISPEERSKGHYRKSLEAMRKFYPATEYDYIFNKVDYTDAGGIEHATRLKIFHKLGYRLNPNFYVDSEGLILRLKGGEIVQYVGEADGAANDAYRYTVRDDSGERDISLSEIDRCVSREQIPIRVVHVNGSIYESPIEIEQNGVRVQEPDTDTLTLVPWKDIDNIDYAPSDSYEVVYCPMIMPLHD